MWPGLQDPFKMAAPSVELFTSFSLGLHPLQKLKNETGKMQRDHSFKLSEGCGVCR